MCSASSVFNFNPIQTSAPEVVYMVFHVPMSSVFGPIPSVHHIPVRISFTGLHHVSRKEFHVHSGESLSSHEVVEGISVSGILARFFMQRHIHHLLVQIVSQFNVRLLPSRTQVLLGSGVFLHWFSWFDFMCLFVYMSCLSGTW